DHHLQPAANDPLDVDLVRHQARLRQHLPGELHLAHAERAATARLAQPRQVEPGELPHGVHPQAARHYRIALEVAGEEPEVGADVELRPDHALAVAAALGGDFRDPVEHQHRRRGEARVAGAEQFAPGAGEQLLAIERGRSGHYFEAWGKPDYASRAYSLTCKTRRINA